MSVQSESESDQLSRGSEYATHPLGGITRKVQLFNVPQVHLSDSQDCDHFDKMFQNATLTAKFAVRNKSARVSSGAVAFKFYPWRIPRQ